MIEQVTNHYRPDTVSVPGETLADLLEEREMSQSELAERTGRPTKTINEIIKGKAAITPETAIQLERVLGVPAEFWNVREAQYRQYLAELEEQERLERDAEWAKSFPLAEMTKLGWIKDVGRNRAEQAKQLLNFFAVATTEQWETGWTKHRLSFRRSSKLATKREPASAWLRKGEIEAAKIECADFDEELLKQRVAELRALTLIADASFTARLTQICSEFGVAVVLVPALKGMPISGAARWLTPKKALIQLSLRYKVNDQIWFTFFHELGHILLHKKKDIFVDIEGEKDNASEELEANLYSGETLIPSEEYQKWIQSTSVFSRETIVGFANKIGIHPGIIVGRLQHVEKLVPPSHLNSLKVYYKWVNED